MKVKVIGAGLAGSEAAWQLAQRGIQVNLIEMRPVKSGPAHHTENFAELVCSNSLRGDRLENAVGLLKEELRRCGSIILECAEATRVEAGGCLAVDRGGIARMVTEKIRNHPNITVVPCVYDTKLFAFFKSQLQLRKHRCVRFQQNNRWCLHNNYSLLLHKCRGRCH